MTRPLGPDGLPIGWEDRAYNFLEMFDVLECTALRYDGKQDLPADWRDESTGFLAIRFGDVVIHESAVNPNHAEDSLFFSINDILWEGGSRHSVDAALMLWLSIHGHDHGCADSQRVLYELRGIVVSGGVWKTLRDVSLLQSQEWEKEDAKKARRDAR